MTSPNLPRVAACCGVLFSVVLFVASGNGNGAYLAPRAVAGLAALALFIPFLAYLCSVLRAAEGSGGWLAPTAFAAGIAGITLKIASVVPALALHRAHIADGTTLHRTFDAMDDAMTVIALYPLAVLCAATAVVALRSGVLPRFIGAGAGLTAAALAVNGAFLQASFVPALLLFVAWTLVASVHLLRSASRRPATGRAPAYPAASR